MSLAAMSGRFARPTQAPAETLTPYTISAAEIRTGNTTGAGPVSFGYPVRPGDLTLQDVIDRKVKVEVLEGSNWVEQSIYTEVTKGRHRDGVTPRTVLIQFQYTIPDTNPITARVTFGVVRGTSDIAKVPITQSLYLDLRVIVPTSPAYLAACRVPFEDMIPSTSEDTDSAAYFGTFFASRFSALQNSQLTDGNYTSTYEVPRSLFARWSATADTQYLFNALKRAHYLLVGYSLPTLANTEINPEPNPNAWTPAVSSSGSPAEQHSQRYLSYAIAYALTGAEEFWNVVCINAQWMSTSITNATIANGTSGYVHGTYYGRWNLRGLWSLSLGVLVDATKVFNGPYGAGRQMNYATQLGLVLDAWEANKWVTGDYRNGVRGTRITIQDDAPAVGEIPVFQLALLTDWLRFNYLEVWADSRIPAWIKNHCEIMVATAQVLEPGESGFGTNATHGYHYWLKASGPGIGVANGWTFPMWAANLAFVHAYYGGNAADGTPWLTWYQRSIKTGTVDPSHLGWDMKIWGEVFGNVMGAPALIANGIPTGLPSSVRTPVQY